MQLQIESAEMTPEDRIADLGLTLPAPMQPPPGVELPFRFVNMRGNRALISGHPKTALDGRVVGPFGQVGKDLSTEEAYLASRDIGLTILANKKAEIVYTIRFSVFECKFYMFALS